MPAKTITESRITMIATATTLISEQNKTDICFLIDEYSTVLYRFCCGITYSKDDADDLFQDTWESIIRKPFKIDMAKNPRSILCAEALYLWKSKQRKYARRKRLAPEDALDHEMDSGLNLEDDYLSKAEKDYVKKVVGKLPDKYRIPLILYYNLEMNLAEIGKTLDLPTGTVKSRLFTARSKVKKGLEKNENS